MNDENDIEKTLSDMETSMDKEDALYVRGKDLYNALNAIDDLRDPRAADEFHQLLNGPFDADALNYYQDHLASHEDVRSKIDIQQAVVKDIPHVSSTIKNPDQKIADVIDTYIKDAQSGARSWVEGTKDKFKMHLLLMADMVGNSSTGVLTSEVLSELYAQRIRLIPKNMNVHKKKFYKNGVRRSIEDVIAIAERDNMPLISDSTRADYVATVRSFLIWAEKRNLIINNTHVALDGYGKVTEKTVVLPFTDDDLRTIFTSGLFICARDVRGHPERYWIPIIALYSGARLGEIAQLRVKDIIKDECSGVWFFNITDDQDGMTVKTQASKRVIPIHDDLINLGLLKYKTYQEKRKQKRLFSHVDVTVKKAGGSNVSKWFSRHLTQFGVKTDRSKVFHSFRHTVINYEKQHSLDTFVMSEIVGHAYDQNKVHGGYQQGFDLKRKQSELNKMRYDVKIPKFDVWK